MLTAGKFWKWIDDHLPADPRPKGVYIGDALLDCSVFTNLRGRVAALEKKIDLKNTNE